MRKKLEVAYKEPRVCQGAPSVSQLLFADDSLILMEADASNAATLRKVLEMYFTSSGQLVSDQLVSDPKSNIFFSPNTSTEDKEAVCIVININV
jgi:hypothetical protein